MLKARCARELPRGANRDTHIDRLTGNVVITRLKRLTIVPRDVGTSTERSGPVDDPVDPSGIPAVDA